MTGEQAPVCLTFDHLGRGRQILDGRFVRPDPKAPEFRAGLPAIRHLLAEHGISATFYVEGWGALHHRDVLESLLGEGHRLGLHGWIHERWSTLEIGQCERILHDGRAALAIAGENNPGFRAPFGETTPDRVALLNELDFSHDASTITRASSPAPRLVRGVAHVPFDWEMVDFWCLRGAQEPVSVAGLADHWLNHAIGLAAQDRPIVLVLHPFFAATDPSIWSAVTDFVSRVAQDPRFRWSDMRELAASIDRGEEPTSAEPRTWQAYLVARSHGPSEGEPAEVQVLSGGVSADVVRMGEVVAKRPRACLAVADPWEADPDRILAEATAMRRNSSVAPEVLDLDRERHILVMSWVGGESWKEQLLAGRIDPNIAGLVGRSLARIHEGDTAGLFDPERMRQLRLDPYFEVAADRLGGDLALLLRELAADLAGCASWLVHGDFSPKNILVEGDEVHIVDWEVAHAGDRLFDLAFLLTHLRSKAVHLPARRKDLERAGASFLRGYDQGSASPLAEPDMDRLARLHGALLLARTDGLSPLEYLSPEEVGRVRRAGALLLENGGHPWRL